MKKILFLIILLCVNVNTYSQTESTLLKQYDQKVIENNNFKNDLVKEKERFSKLSDAYKKDTLELQKSIKNLRKELLDEKEKNLDLTEIKVKQDRYNLKIKIDSLQMKFDSLNSLLFKQNQTILDKDKLIANEKINAKNTAENAKNEGKTESLLMIVNSYKNSSFDELVRSSTKESVDRDNKILNNHSEVKSIINDLLLYFNATGFISDKFNALNISNAKTQLSQIKRQSKLLDRLKENVESYEDFNEALKETIKKLINLDNLKSASGDTVIQALKFQEIVIILSNYIYNYYEYNQYLNLSNVVTEILKRKKSNADASITDLLEKL